MEILKEHGPELRRWFGLRRLSVFGSMARGEALSSSDVGPLLEFEGTPDFDQYMDLKFFIEDPLGRKVDLATANSLRTKLRPQIEHEAVDVA